MRIKTMMWVAAGIAAMAAVGAVEAQQRIDDGTPSFFGGHSSFGGYYDTYGDNGGHQGFSGYGTYRRRDEGASSTSAATATIATVPLPGGAETPKSCAWLKRQADRTHERRWRKRYAACLNDFSSN